MDPRIKTLIDTTKEKFGLQSYYLKRHDINRDINTFNQTVYTLSMEWFPNGTESTDDGLNPEGTAVIELELNTQKVRSAIFVNSLSFVEGVAFSKIDLETIIAWVEQETHLTYHKQFQLKKHEENQFVFTSCWNGTDTFPLGKIEIQFDSDGKMVLYSVIGSFPADRLVQEETYTLSLDRVEQIARQQLQLINWPDYEKEQVTPVYGIEEIYITNDGKSTIPFEPFDETKGVNINQTITWNTHDATPFEAQDLDLDEEITVEQAFSNEPSPDTFTITFEEQEHCIKTVTQFLSQVYSDDSEKWKIVTLHRDKGYIVATLRLVNERQTIIPRKLSIFLDPKTFEVINYIDNLVMTQMTESFNHTGHAEINHQEAFDNIKDDLELKPCYVYSSEYETYILCGKLDCDMGVSAVDGEVDKFFE
ncbi:hypothetical protein [Tenuibacillus multivorans]|uniref:Uncharacterized protein n=1 Tax=Tenuibacillus multivorans TaxID=237069 RepID=A0A1H0BTE0_9BACI|nr:hypothetical protein [Tenuibacillus multivorans]GEL77043.1 hypothetical protein TMU01_12780 [Tenuibacillus multivorans]SDN48841.1 hypothetical protein SAMN05216498_2379 [Tenuibacillus multivorans]